MGAGAGIKSVEAVFLLLLVFVAMFAGLARRLKVPYPILLVIAGILEGFVSPIEWWPLEGKLAISGVTLVFLVMYLRGGLARGSAPDHEESEPEALALSTVATARRAS